MLRVSHIYVVLGSLLFYEPFERASGFARTSSLTRPRFRQQSRKFCQKSKRVSNILRASSPGCSVELIDPDTGCEIVLVGCFHGSQSSAKDVEGALLSERLNGSDERLPIADVVVLELCASRFADLRRDYATMNRNSNGTALSVLGGPPKTKKKNGPWLFRFAKMVRQTFETRGLSTAVAAAVLGGVGGLQTSLSGLQPGLEFTTALGIASSNSNLQIVLADQNVDEILNRLGRIQETSFNMWEDFLQTKNWHESSFGKEASALQTALFGASDLKKQVTLPSFLTRNRDAIRDLVRLAVPPFMLLQGLNMLAGQWTELAMGSQELPLDNPIDPSMLDSTIMAPMALILLPWLANLAFIFLIYTSLALPATRIILSDRDDQLASGIRHACKLAATGATRRDPSAGGSRRGRVVAVLGFLHVNGVAQRLLCRDTDKELDDAIPTTVGKKFTA